MPIYPLLNLGWTRKDCLDWLRGRTPHPVPWSACVFCPLHDNAAWRDLRRDDPDGWLRAVEADAALRSDRSVCRRGFRQPLHLHRSRRPLADIESADLAPEPLNPMAADCHGMCGV